MPSSLELIAGGVAYDLSDRLAYLHLGNEGFGMAPVARRTQQGPRQHGETDRGFQLQPRTIQLVLLAMAEDEAGYWARRDELLSAFAPREAPLGLRFTRPDGQVRQIDCHLAGELRLGSRERLGEAMHRVAVALRCPDPTWYDPATVALSFGVAAGGGSFAVPLAMPWSVGASVINQTTSVAYPGSWRASPVVVIHGPITDPLVENLTTGERLSLAGTTVAAGDSYTVDTRDLYGTVVDAAGASRLGRLSDDSDLTTFHLAATTEAAGGVNSLRVTGTAATAATQIFIRYQARYLGI